MAGSGTSTDSTETGQAPVGLCALAWEYKEQAWKAHERFHGHATLSHWTHLALGIAGAIAAVAAGTAAIKNDHPLPPESSRSSLPRQSGSRLS